MSSSKKIYRSLQKHLDKHNVGFPALRSGVDIRILKHYFTPQEAEIALKMDYKYETIKVVYERLPDIDVSFEEFKEIIEQMVKKGGIMFTERDGEPLIKTLPFVVGMYEHKVYNLTPEFVSDFRELTQDKYKYGISFISTEVPQMRTIPVERSIKLEKPSIASYDSIKKIIEDTRDPIIINECICRQAKEVEGHSCQVSNSKERCIAFRELAKLCIKSGFGREIPKEEALEIIEQCEKEGLILQPSNAQEPEFICCCCKCCCGILNAHSRMPWPAKYWATNYFAKIDIDICKGCGICAKNCQVNAIEFKEAKKPPKINLKRCIGCGVCSVKCPSKAITLLHKKKEIIPPKTDDDLYETIMQHKKGRIGSLLRVIKRILK